MRLLGLVVAGVLLAGAATGCALKPPKPKDCEGEFHPVNAPAPGEVVSKLSGAENVSMCSRGIRNG